MRPSQTRWRHVVLASVTTLGLIVPSAAANTASESEPVFGWDLLEDPGSLETFHSLDAVSEDIAWAASVDQTVVRTVDGETFTDVTPPRGSSMNFFDVEANDANHAMVLGVDFVTSLIYHTSDGGVTWREAFAQSGYFNCIAMFDRQHGFAFGDPVDGDFQVILTRDAGRSWTPIPGSAIPDAVPGEGADQYAGNCAAATGQRGFFGTAYAGGRVFRTEDRGHTWTVSAGPGASISSLDFRTNRLGLVMGGSWMRTTDGGVTFEELEIPVPVYDVAWWSDRRGDERLSIDEAQKTAFAVGYWGSKVSRDRGKTWTDIDGGAAFHSVDCVELACWAVGNSGIGKLTVE